MSMTELILQARNQKASELLFLVGSDPRARIQGEWQSLRKQPLMPSEWTVLQQTLLNASQRDSLAKLTSVVGETLLGGARFGFSFFQNESTSRLLLNLVDSEISLDFLPPTPVYEAMASMQGLTLMVGRRDAKLTQTLQSLLQKFNTERSFICLVVSADPFAQIREDKASFIYESGHSEQWHKNEILKGVDLIVLHGVHTEENLIRAVELAEAGVTVIYTMNSASVMGAIKQSYSILQKHWGKLGSARFADVLRMCYGQVATKGLEQSTVLASEFATIKPHIRSYVEQEDLKSLEALLRGTAESVGVQSLNQSLLQHLVRRRIDLKSAFLLTQDPENLDLLLKKVGV